MIGFVRSRRSAGYFRRVTVFAAFFTAFFAAGRVAFPAAFFADAFFAADFFAVARFAPVWRDEPPKMLSHPDENASVEPVCTV